MLALYLIFLRIVLVKIRSINSLRIIVLIGFVLIATYLKGCVNVFDNGVNLSRSYGRGFMLFNLNWDVYANADDWTVTTVNEPTQSLPRNTIPYYALLGDPSDSREAARL